MTSLPPATSAKVFKLAVLDANDDDALMCAFAKGTPSAGRAIVSRHLPHIHTLAFRMLGDRTEAEDVAQDTFMSAWRAAPTWEPGRAKLSTWLHRIAMNKCLDRLRKKKPEALPTDFDGASDGLDPEQELLNREMGERVNAAIQSLPDRQRAAITLSLHQQLSNPEAAEILEISIDAMESLLARARRTLKEILHQDGTEIFPTVSVGWKKDGGPND